MNLSESHIAELRVPVQRARVEMHTEHDRRTTVIFLAPDCRAEDIFESDTPFFPAEDGGSIRLYARSSVVSVVLDAGEAAPESLALLGVSYHVRTVAVYLRNGKMVIGQLRSLSAHTRTLDLMNMPARSFAVHADGKIHHMAKAHVERIEELR